MILLGQDESGWPTLPCSVLAGLPDCAKSVYFVFLFIGVDFEFCAVLFKIVVGHIKVRNLEFVGEEMLDLV